MCVCTHRIAVEIERTNLAESELHRIKTRYGKKLNAIQESRAAQVRLCVCVCVCVCVYVCASPVPRVLCM